MTGAELLPIVIGVLAAAGGGAGIGSLFRIGIERRKSRAEAAGGEASNSQVISDTAVGLLEPLRTQIEYLGEELVASRHESRAARTESQELRAEVHELREYIAVIVAALAQAGAVVPAPPPGVVRSAVPPPA